MHLLQTTGGWSFVLTDPWLGVDQAPLDDVDGDGVDDSSDGTLPAVSFVGVEKEPGELAGLGGDDLGADAAELAGLADDDLGADLVGGLVVSVPDDFLAATAEAGAGDEAEAKRRTDDDRLAKLLSAVFIILCRAGWCS